MAYHQLGKVEFVDWPGQLSMSEAIPLIGDIRTSQRDSLAHHRAKVSEI